MNLYRCLECDALMETHLEAANPFDPEYLIYGCPQCKEVNSTLQVCQAEGCTELATCGIPTSEGYRQTCHKHLPRDA